MIKKIVVTMILLLVGIYMYNIQFDKRHLELKLGSMAGHNLFLLITTYEEIAGKLNSDNLNAESIGDIEKKLVKIEGYSSIIDSIVEHDALQIISNRFQDIFTHLKKNHISIKSSKDKTLELVEIKNMIHELIGTIYQTYYEKDNIEGGKAELYIKDFNKIEAYQKKMDEFYERFTKIH